MTLTLELERRIYAAMKREPVLEVVCCWCTPHHVIQVGVQPTSHGACPIGIKKFERGDR